MAGYNRVVLIGNLTRDPEYKQLASGQPVCRLGLAVNRQYKNRQTGDVVQEVCFIDVDVWGAQAESCRQYLQKGRQVLVEGRLKLDSWEDPTHGQKRHKHSIVADRVVFLANQAQEFGTAELADSSSNVDANNHVEKELFDKIEHIKQKAKATQKKAPQKSEEEISSTDEQSSDDTKGEIAFKDEPPFQDDLPF